MVLAVKCVNYTSICFTPYINNSLKVVNTAFPLSVKEYSALGGFSLENGLNNINQFKSEMKSLEEVSFFYCLKDSIT